MNIAEFLLPGMPEKFIGSWPEGTKEVKKGDGKKEIVLPKPTDMNQFSREEIANKVLMRELNKGMRVSEGAISPQFSIDKEAIRKGLWDKVSDKKVPRRQEQLVKEKRVERSFAATQKAKGAENYGRLFER